MSVLKIKKKINFLNLSNNNFKQIFNFNNNSDYFNGLNRLITVKINVDGTNQGNIIVKMYTDLLLNDMQYLEILFQRCILPAYVIDFQNEGNVTFLI
jgi:hypothetical protein